MDRFVQFSNFNENITKFQNNWLKINRFSFLRVPSGIRLHRSMMSESET